MNLALLLALQLCCAAGLPSYSSDTYYDDYDEEEYDDDGEDGLDHEQENLEEMGLLAKMNTVGETFTVDAGTTIRLPCHIDNLHDSYYPNVIWSRLDQMNTQISFGDKIVSEDYTQRAVVKMSQSGPTLTIAAAGSSDAGRYKCSLTVGNNTQVLVQTVHIRGETSTDKLLVVSQGDEMTLSCNISEEGDTPTVSWSKQGAGRLPGGKESQEGPLLKVTNVQLADAGVYVCTASDRKHKAVEKTVKVTVLPTPEASSAINLYSSVLAFSVVFLCL